jgi:hypothetical protein
MIKRLIQRGLYYMQTGSTLGSLPLSLLNFLTIFYYNVVISVGVLSNVFPQFYLFVLIGGIFVIVFFGLLGYAYKRKSNFFVSQVEVDIDANPYQRNKIAPISVPFWEIQVEMIDAIEKIAKAHDMNVNLDCTLIKEILGRSGSLKYPLVKNSE